ncbi:hypothetical protein Ccrd_017757 [Cynara cardunculus var. scolymus]|uniref:Transmembrane protein n=1 Tax=Cynara cardunculus var. scolymus TaxID=59895 RepID=A0A118K283_CYNCS|nr:hypothetical protein Ccrd_017757 [Cynara cardunculus var. scolymus]
MAKTESTVVDETSAPLIAQHEEKKEKNFMVYISTFVAVCGSFAFGSCALRISTAFCTAGWLAIYFAQLMICAGVSVAFIIGTMLAWRTLALTGKQKEFEAALRKLRGKDVDVSEEADEIQIGVGLMVCQQFGGINGICFYTSSIFESAGYRKFYLKILE